MYTTRMTKHKRRTRQKRETRMTELGGVLRAKREETGESMRVAAERIDVSHGTLSEWENGIRQPNHEQIVKIHRAYGLPLDELVRMVARDAGIELPEQPSYERVATALAARALAFPQLEEVLRRIQAADPASYQALLLMLDLWNHRHSRDDTGQS